MSNLLNTKKVLSIVVMSLCLLLLTGVNFFIYPPTTSFAASLITTSENTDEQAPTPVEEKSSSKVGLTVQEEYIHEHFTIRDQSAFIVLSKHKIPTAEKLQIVHFELVSPPPKA